MQPAVNLFEYERLARARMTPMAFDYYARRAMDEITVRAKRRAFDAVTLASCSRSRHDDGADRALRAGARAICGLFRLRHDGRAG
jgi:isopentenyl diphosphate isomerase/L-lactate dehydrogenase-like FMN-dependent dehydrogenase